MTGDKSEPRLCRMCDRDGRGRYCAPNRCYCGHWTCHAFASWVDLHKDDPK